MKSFCDIAAVKRLFILNVLIICVLALPAVAQIKNSDSLEIIQNRRLIRAELITGAVYVGSMSTLYQAWYRDYPFQKFHFFNDFPEWKCMDKLGHATTSWWAAQCLYNGQKLSGITKGDELFRAALIPLCFMTTIEVFDGFSSGWGFSLGDMSANVGGLSLFLIQEHYWNEQKITLKYSFHHTDLAAKRPALLGANKIEQLLKDYNGQTYWINAPINRKGWLCISLGYGASGMLGARNNMWTNESGSYDYSSIPRYSTWSLSMDIDLLKLPFKSKGWKWFSTTFRWIKIPAPTVQWSSYHGFKAFPIYF